MLRFWLEQPIQGFVRFHDFFPQTVRSGDQPIVVIAIDGFPDAQ